MKHIFCDKYTFVGLVICDLSKQREPICQNCSVMRMFSNLLRFLGCDSVCSQICTDVLEECAASIIRVKEEQVPLKCQDIIHQPTYHQIFIS